MPAYPCEDIGSYYAGLEGLAGDELRTKLAAVVSPHAALRYKDVGLPVAFVLLNFVEFRLEMRKKDVF